MNRILVANWKMNGSIDQFSTYLTDLQNGYSFKNIDLIIAPPFPYINIVKNKIVNKNIFIAGQTMNYLPDGAKTGEVNARMLKDVGSDYVIIGHSECRENRSFDDIDASKTVLSALEKKLKVIFCIGEKKTDSMSNEIIIEQLVCALEGIDKKYSEFIIVAYEPVWSIGTGVTPTPEQVLQKRQIIYATLYNLGFLKTQIIYGGSVTVQNAGSFINNAQIDGFIVGKACMHAGNIIEMLNIL